MHRIKMYAGRAKRNGGPRVENYSNSGRNVVLLVEGHSLYV